MAVAGQPGQTRQGLHRDVSRAARRCADASTATTGPVDMSAAGKLMSPAPAGRALQAGPAAPGRARPWSRSIAHDDPAGFGPAMQIVTDYATMLMDSVTVLLHRLGVAYKAIMNPVLRVRREPGRGAAGHPAGLGSRQLPRRHRRGLDPRPAVRFRRPQGGRGGQAACCPACSPTPARLRSTRVR